MDANAVDPIAPKAPVEATEEVCKTACRDMDRLEPD